MTITEAYGVGWTDRQVDGGVMDKGWITGPSGVFHAKGFTILSCGKWGVVDFCAGEYLREAGCGGEGPRDSGEPCLGRVSGQGHWTTGLDTLTPEPLPEEEGRAGRAPRSHS